MSDLGTRLGAALQYLRRGDLAAGEQLLRAILRDHPQAPAALHLAGTVALQRGRLAEAIEKIGAAVAADPALAAAHADLGLALTMAGRLDEAGRQLRRALELKPDFPAAWLNLGNVCREGGDGAGAATCYRKALALHPDFPEAHNNLAAIALADGKPDEAEAGARRALALRPGFAEAWQTLASVFDALGRLDEAVAAHRQAIALRPRSARAHADLAATLMAFGRIEEAIAGYETALALEPGHDEWRRILGKIRSDRLSVAEQRERYEAAAPSDRMELGFALGKALEDQGDFDAAFPYYAAANALKRASFTYDPAESEASFAAIAEAFTPELFERHRQSGDPDRTPIFVVGMPRSGTTLVEQILASHPDVFGAGELALLRNLVAGLAGGDTLDFPTLLPTLDAARLGALGSNYVAALRAYSASAPRITDKMPGNFLLIGMIRLALPNATIIHCVRDPADTAISIYKNLFTSGILRYAYDLGELGHYHRLYQGLMAHWHRVLPGVVHDIAYEALVADQEGETRRLLAHCGLDFRPECLRFFETARPVHTASAAQVRNPISAASVGIARRYGAALAPLHAALAGRKP